jgi:hypothetical protein
MQTRSPTGHPPEYPMPETTTHVTDGKPTQEQIAYCAAKHKKLHGETLLFYTQFLCEAKKENGHPLLQSSPAAA